jgi:DNA processing protein
MPSSDESAGWVTLTRTPSLDIDSLLRALEILGPPQRIVDASDAEREGAGLSAAAREFLSSGHGALNRTEEAWLQNPRHHIVPFTDPRYPELLRRSGPRPIALYVAGSADVLNDPQVALVGSRNPTPQGRETAEQFAEQLAARGLAITSGLALGIDSAAHHGALRAHGITLAVLGSGIDVIYPSCNRRLSIEIMQQGALISVFPLSAPPRREHFPQRNGIIAAMSLGTLVVEAARRSGSLITARLARALGRALFAVPGSIHNPLSAGCHELIRQGARLTETAHDILSVLDFPAFFAARTRVGANLSAAARAELPMDKDQKILLDALGFDPADLDALVVRTGLKPEAVSSMMLILELEGHVQAAPGGRYSRVVRSRR